jgi:hypothetical protein
MATFTPPLTTRPSARTSSPRGGSAATSSTAARRPAIISASNRFSGGLSSVIVASAPSRASETGAMRGQAPRSASAAARISSSSPGAGCHGSFNGSPA